MERRTIDITPELLSKLKPPEGKSSWYYINEAKRKAATKHFFMGAPAQAEYWREYHEGKEWYVFGGNGVDSGQWYRRTEVGREKIVEPDWFTNWTPGVPIWCPVCKKPMKHEHDTKSYRRFGFCFYCHINKLAEVSNE